MNRLLKRLQITEVFAYDEKRRQPAILVMAGCR